jgi:hypothetical protein
MSLGIGEDKITQVRKTVIMSRGNLHGVAFQLAVIQARCS